MDRVKPADTTTTTTKTKHSKTVRIFYGQYYRPLPFSMVRLSTLLALNEENPCGTGADGLPHKGPVMRSFYVSLILVRSSSWTLTQSSYPWFETLWHHCNVLTDGKRSTRVSLVVFLVGSGLVENSVLVEWSPPEVLSASDSSVRGRNQKETQGLKWFLTPTDRYSYDRTSPALQMKKNNCHWPGVTDMYIPTLIVYESSSHIIIRSGIILISTKYFVRLRVILKRK